MNWSISFGQVKRSHQKRINQNRSSAKFSFRALNGGLTNSNAVFDEKRWETLLQCTGSGPNGSGDMDQPREVKDATIFG
jgi:hypothetical protein